MKGLSKGRYDETLAGEDDVLVENRDLFYTFRSGGLIHNLEVFMI